MQLSAKASSLRGQIAACVPSSLKLEAPQGVINTVCLWTVYDRELSPSLTKCGKWVASKLTDMFVRWLGQRTGRQDVEKQKGSNECLFILTRTHSMQIFGEIPFIKPQNDTETTDKRLKTMKNEWKMRIFFGWDIATCSLLGRLLTGGHLSRLVCF